MQFFNPNIHMYNPSIYANVNLGQLDADEHNRMMYQKLHGLKKLDID